MGALGQVSSLLPLPPAPQRGYWLWLLGREDVAVAFFRKSVSAHTAGVGQRGTGHLSM